MIFYLFSLNIQTGSQALMHLSGSTISRLDRWAHILTKWVARFDGNIDLESAEERPDVIDCFIRQNISFGGKVYSFCFAYVRWFQPHPERFYCQNPGLAPEVWCSSLYETLGPSSFLYLSTHIAEICPRV